jgi:hypothetical protein
MKNPILIIWFCVVGVLNLWIRKYVGAVTIQRIIFMVVLVHVLFQWDVFVFIMILVALITGCAEQKEECFIIG